MIMWTPHGYDIMSSMLLISNASDFIRNDQYEKVYTIK